VRVSKKATILLLAFILLSDLALAADLTYPYIRGTLTVPAGQDPYPGLGTYYSAVSSGMKTVLWNPASLGNLKLSEASYSSILQTNTYSYTRNTNVAEPSGTWEGGSYAIFLREPSAIGPGIATREVQIASNAYYNTNAVANNFSSAMKVFDWLTLGFSTGNNTGADLDFAGDLPGTGRLDTNLYGKNMGSMEITTAGKLKFTSGSQTFETTSAVWNGFISQEVDASLTNASNLRNNLNFESPYMATLASTFNGFSLGLNVIPISATAQIENEITSMLNSNQVDQVMYIPNFDPNNPTQIAQWASDPALYGTAAGYSSKYITLNAGDIVATTKYQGYFTASTTQMDFGAMYSPSEWFSLGFAMENFGGAALDFQGSGINYFVNYRQANSIDFNSFLQPGSSSTYDPLSDQWTSTTEVNSTQLYIESLKHYQLPRKTRLGLTLKKPFTICFDYEQNLTPIHYTDGTNDITIADMNFIRFGGETSILMLPIYLRGATVLMLKPTVTGLNTTGTDAFNNAFRFGVLPVRLDLGTYFNSWGTEWGIAVGADATPVLSALQVDTTDADLSKLVWGTLFLKRDYWQLDYKMCTDVLGTAAAYGSKDVPAGETRSFGTADLRFVQTLGVTYKF